MENNFYTHFYNATSILKNHYKKFIGIILFGICVSTIDLIYSVAADDVTKIVSTLVIGLLGVFSSVYLANKYYALLNDTEFSLRKVFWDIPTYLFYELGLGLAFLVGVLLLILPGIYILFFFAHVPIVSICFDHLDEEGSLFSLTKKAISQNIMLNLGIYILMALNFFLFLGVENLYLMTGQNLIICMPLIVILVHILIIIYGIILSMLNTSFLNIFTKNDETQNLDRQ